MPATRKPDNPAGTARRTRYRIIEQQRHPKQSGLSGSRWLPEQCDATIHEMLSGPSTKTVDGREACSCFAFDHIARERPGRGRETQNGNVRTNRSNDATDGLHEKSRFCFWIEA